MVAGAVGGTAIRRVLTNDSPEQMSVTILTLPADNDRRSSQIARTFEKNLSAVGINATIEPRSRSQLLRAVLLEHDFDCFVASRHGGSDPDYLYELFHSTYDPEAGWQNPYGFTNLEVDDLLERQRSMDGDERTEAITDLLTRIAQAHPIVPICRTDDRRVVRTDRFDGWSEHPLGRKLGYLGLEPIEHEWDDGEDVILRGIITDTRPTRNLNPLAATQRDQGTIIDLLYDSLAVPNGGSFRPWLAESWEWDESTATVTIRPDCQFHDGQPVTSQDIEFTYEFFADTSLGDEQGVRSPAPRHRGLIDIVESTSVLDGQTVEIEVDAHADVAERALTIPILPRHVWKPEVETRLENGQNPIQGTWSIVSEDGISTIGSGPYAFVEREQRERLRLERFDRHFTTRDTVDFPEPSADEIRFEVALNSGLVLRGLSGESATQPRDMTAMPMAISEIGEITDDALELVEPQSWQFYHIGFNVRNAPFSNPNFRKVVAGLIDREMIVSDVFGGYATPIVTPVTDEWTPKELEWDGTAPYAPFFRKSDETRSEGSDTLDVEQAKRAFEGYGFQYSDDRERLVR
ncbi:ABC transporter substrate-binding protein [Halostagnicola kamekurae]|uniref:ABC transporter substrate-binding protein n=1 Tax=Halostagnicola kamekurae TaxID=619731 RepID=UPI001FEA68D0|nr:ABC transporter substrate-binding protein [Halostagnicola kamekurae]